MYHHFALSMQLFDSRCLDLQKMHPNDESDTVANRSQEVYSTQYSFAHLSGYPFYENPVFAISPSPQVLLSPIEYTYTPPVPFLQRQHQFTSNRRHARSDSRILSRRTTLCKHFMNNSDCPMKDQCAFIHDDAIESPEPHCWAFVQGRCRTDPCAYYHPRIIEPYKRYTPCIAWLTCIGAPFCPFKHAEDVDVRKAAGHRRTDGSRTRVCFGHETKFNPPLQHGDTSRQEQIYVGSCINGHGNEQTRNCRGPPSIEIDGTTFYQQPTGVAPYTQDMALTFEYSGTTYYYHHGTLV